ncbi:hypothetical protein ACTWM0_09030 [Pseudomonas machongensis]
MIKSSLLLLSLLVSQSVMATPEPVVEAWLRKSVAVLDDQGKSLHQVDSSSLPKAPKVLQYNKELDIIQVGLPEGDVWMDTMAVRVNPPLNIVKFPCQTLQSGYSDDHQNNSTIGYGAGCKK